MRKILKGSVIISRTMGGRDETPIHITIEDESSGCRVLEVYMALDEFAKALTASYGKATIEHFPDSPIGKKHESKTEVVPYKWSMRDDKSEEDAALAAFEVDGWKARRSDLTNHHCSVGDHGQRVTFHRYVEINNG